MGLSLALVSTKSDDYQESTKHVEGDEVDDGEAAAAGSLLSRVVVRLGITQLSRQTGQHDLLPRLTCSTSDIGNSQHVTAAVGGRCVASRLTMTTDLKSMRTA